MLDGNDAFIAGVGSDLGVSAARNVELLMAATESRPPAVSDCLCEVGVCVRFASAAYSDLVARRWAWLLTAATIAWNAIEAVVAIGSGVVAGSIALVGFGLDSVVEVSRDDAGGESTHGIKSTSASATALRNSSSAAASGERETVPRHDRAARTPSRSSQREAARRRRESQKYSVCRIL